MINSNATPRNGVMTITPAIAADWLEHRNKGNRHISAVIVKKYAEAMREGRWMVTHQGIAFDEEGLLLDGQHRLFASVESNITIQANVSVGISRATFSVLDTGRKRQANQLIDHPNRTSIAAAARIVGYLDGVIPHDKNIHGGVVPSKVDNDIILGVVDLWPELAAWAAQAQASHAAARILPSAHLAVAAQASRSPYGHLLDSWFEGIRSGAGLNGDDPRLLLRNRFIQGSDISGHGSTRMARAYQLIAKAWNAYALGKPVRVLKLFPEQKPPAVVGARMRTPQ